MGKVNYGEIVKQICLEIKNSRLGKDLPYLTVDEIMVLSGYSVHIARAIKAYIKMYRVNCNNVLEEQKVEQKEQKK